MRRGDYDEPALEQQLDNRGLMNRFFGRLTKTITKPHQMYPVGVLFGLGFDTATEVALLVLAGRRRRGGPAVYAILCLPILFAAGMSLLDTIDGSFMNFAYGWAFSRPLRKVYYNLTITGLSVAVALVIGTIELGGLLAERLSLLGLLLEVVRGHRHQPPWLRARGDVRATWGIALAVLAFGRSRNAGRGISTRRRPRAHDPRPAYPAAAGSDVAAAAAALRARGGASPSRAARSGGAVRRGRSRPSNSRRVSAGTTPLADLGLPLTRVPRGACLIRHVHLGHGPGLYALAGANEREYLACERCHRVTAVEAAFARPDP